VPLPFDFPASPAQLPTRYSHHLHLLTRSCISVLQDCPDTLTKQRASTWNAKKPDQLSPDGALQHAWQRAPVHSQCSGDRPQESLQHKTVKCQKDCGCHQHDQKPQICVSG
jgi:hypothetical protein